MGSERQWKRMKNKKCNLRNDIIAFIHCGVEPEIRKLKWVRKRLNIPNLCPLDGKLRENVLAFSIGQAALSLVCYRQQDLDIAQWHVRHGEMVKRQKKNDTVCDTVSDSGQQV